MKRRLFGGVQFRSGRFWSIATYYVGTARQLSITKHNPNMKLQTFLTVVFFFLVMSAPVLASYSAEGFNTEASEVDGRVVIRFTGAISPGHAKVVSELHNLVAADIKKRAQIGEYKEPWLVMNSKGGSVNEAMVIGRWLRHLKGMVMVPVGGECFSSCIYVLAGGSTRIVVGDVGIHRPFLTRSSTEDHSAVMRSVLTKSREFFFEMGVSEKLADDMFGVEPEQNKILSPQLLTQYRLNQTDIGLKEEQSLAQANRLGISRQEYNARRSLFLKDMEVCGLLRPEKEIYKCSDKSAKKHGLN